MEDYQQPAITPVPRHPAVALLQLSSPRLRLRLPAGAVQLRDARLREADQRARLGAALREPSGDDWMMGWMMGWGMPKYARMNLNDGLMEAGFLGMVA